MSILHIWRVAKSLDACKIDPTFAQPITRIDQRGLPRPPKRPIAVAFLAYIWRCLRKPAPPLSRPRQTKLVFFADSQNQIASVTPIITGVSPTQNPALVLLNTQTRPTGPQGGDIYLPLSLWGRVMGIILGLIFLPRLILQLRVYPGLAHHYLGRFLEIYRLLPGAITIVNKMQPELLVVANDHTPACRLICYLTRQAGGKTLYLQHAQVSKSFPPLDFDYAFLDGQIALQIYQDIAAPAPLKDITIFLNGEKKTQSAKPLSGGACIGLAFSTIDRLDRAAGLVQHMRRHRPDPILIRLHPAIDPGWASQLQNRVADLPDVTVSSAKDSPVGPYFQQLQFLIAGDSSIHIDAQLHGLPSYHAPLHDNPNYQDYYGFLAQGMIPPLPDNITDLPHGYQPATDILQHYSASFGTKWQNQEGLLSAKTIEALLAQDHQEIARLYTQIPSWQGNYWRLAPPKTG